jgi:kynurenine formamidase
MIALEALHNLRLIDLSVALEHDAPGELSPPRIEYLDHQAGGRMAQLIFDCKQGDLAYSSGGAWAVENLTVNSHTGTHIDAPYHYGPTSGGQPAKRIDDVPLEWCFGPGVVFDMRHKQDGDLIGIADLQQELERIGYTLAAGDIVLIHTGAATRWGSREYLLQPGLGRESTLWLVEQGIHLIGIDAWTLDRSFSSIAAEFQRTRDARILWEAHFAGLEREYCQIEKLANLELIPQPHGFWVSALPVKIKGGSAGWCRAVAMVPR